MSCISGSRSCCSEVNRRSHISGHENVGGLRPPHLASRSGGLKGDNANPFLLYKLDLSSKYQVTASKQPFFYLLYIELINDNKSKK